MSRLFAGVLVATVLAAAGCGGGGGGGSGSLPEGASVAPKSAVGFIALNSDFSSDQWKKLTVLSDRFPGTRQLIAELKKQAKGLDFDRDVRPAVGPEFDVVILEPGGVNDPAGEDVIGLTKPDTKAKLEALLAKTRSEGEANPATAQIGDWVAIADKQAQLDQFKVAAEQGKLSEDDDFKQAFEKLDADSSARWWVRGDFVQSALDRELVSGGAPGRLTRELGDLRAIAGFAKAKADGAALELDGVIDPTPNPATFSPSLPEDVPAGALLYFSTTNLDAPVRAVLRLVSKSFPNFDTQRSQVEGVLGLSLEKDIYPLLRGESALAIYPGQSRIPPILFLQKVDDEKKADSLLRRFTAIAQLGGGIQAETVQLGGQAVQKLTFEGTGVTIYDGVANGRLFVTNASRLAEQTIGGPSQRLADDELFRSARDAAGVPDKVAVFAYGDLKNGLPYVFRLSEQSGRVVPPEAFTNVKPLNGAVVYLVKDGDALRMSGFATIK